MGAFYAATGPDFLAADAEAIVGVLARQQVWHFRTSEAAQMPAWRDSIATLKAAILALAQLGHPAFILLEYPILRLGRRIDAVILTDRAILSLEFKREQADADALRQTEDYALDLFDFHEHSRTHAIIPVLVTHGTVPFRDMGLPFNTGVQPVHVLPPERLADGLAALLHRIGAPRVPLDAKRWLSGAYRPVPTIIEAACMLYARNGVAEIAEARADQRNLHETTRAIRSALIEARAAAAKIVLFVTGIPGAGKTLCGLNAVFGSVERQSVFLTGNPTLVHVLREALARDAADNRAQLHLARRRMEGAIQQLPKFRNHYLVNEHERPAEQIMVIDEAQRCWSADYAIRKTRDKPVQLTQSEPAHLLDIAARHDGFTAVVCLIGTGQEIHDGEGGLAEWGTALRERPAWHVLAAPDAAPSGMTVSDTRRRLGPLPGLRLDPSLHLDVPVRQIRNAFVSDWVDTMLHGRAEDAAAIAREAGGMPFWIVRDVPALRHALRSLARGSRRSGLLASSGAARLRAEGLGAELPHMDEAAVAHWFLDRFPADVRASDALEQVATEFSCQGLELDYVGLCWDADLIRAAGGWRPRNFVGKSWQIMKKPERIANQINTYRVLLTRARYDTVIFVPYGSADDATRDPAFYESIATYLKVCGVRPFAHDARIQRVDDGQGRLGE